MKTALLFSAKVITLFIVFSLTRLAAPSPIFAACTRTSDPTRVTCDWIPGGSGSTCSETCSNTSSGGSVGRTFYNCTTDGSGVTSCYNHEYQCDTPCAGGGGSSGGSCSAECRAGTTCGSGYTSASGCGPIDATHPNSGCRSTQACCRATSCSGSSTSLDCGWEYACRAAGSCNSGGWDGQVSTSNCGGCPSVNNPRHCCRREVCQVVCNGAGPLNPQLLSPLDDSLTPNTAVNLSWIVPGWGDNCASNTTNVSEVYIDECSATGDPVDPSTTIDYSVNAPSGTGLSAGNMTFNGVNGRTYCWRVRANNGSRQSEYSITWRFTITGGITGTVYDDNAGVCSTANPSNLGASLTAVWGADSTSVASNGTFSITATDTPPQNLSITGVPANYICVPGCGTCPTKFSVNPPSLGNNFFFTQARAAWWQVDGAGVYAGAPAGQSIKSTLPLATTRLVLGTTNDQGAIVKRSTSAPDLGTGTQVSDNQWMATSAYKGKTLDYDFFAAHIGVTSATTDHWGGASTLSTGPLSTVRDFYFTRPAGGTTTITSNWTVGASNSYVIFVDGDLTIDADITVANGGFLAFIVSGDVHVAPGVANVAGIFVIDGLYDTQADSTQLTTQGTVVTWTGVSLNRDLGGAANISNPAEKFVYRPDFLVNMPENMKTFILNWQEVAPGTFGN